MKKESELFNIAKVKRTAAYDTLCYARSNREVAYLDTRSRYKAASYAIDNFADGSSAIDIKDVRAAVDNLGRAHSTLNAADRKVEHALAIFNLAADAAAVALAKINH